MATQRFDPTAIEAELTIVTGWQTYLHEAAQHLLYFARRQSWQRAVAYIEGLLSSAERKNAWQLAEVNGAACLIWAVEVVNALAGRQLDSLGDSAASLAGLIGIPLSPFIHGSMGHVMINTVPFLVLGSLVGLRGKRVFLGVSLMVILCGGAALWIFGRASYHIGASGWYERSTGAILTALLTLFLYGGLVWSVLPNRSFISWEGHLFGMLSGVLAARLKGSQE